MQQLSGHQAVTGIGALFRNLAAETRDRLLSWCGPACSELGIDVSLPERNGAQRQRGMIDAGLGMREIYAAIVEETRRTYAGQLGTAEVTR